MNFEIYDKPESLDYEILDSAMFHALEFLELKPSLPIQVYFENLEPCVHGYCDVEDSQIFLNVSSELSQVETVQTLFHELIHAKQFLEGKIDFDAWPNTSHSNLPWEIEANEIEQLIWKTYEMV